MFFIDLDIDRFESLTINEFIGLYLVGPPLPADINATSPPKFWITGSGQLSGTSFGKLRGINEAGTELQPYGVPRCRYTARLHMKSPYDGTHIRYTLDGSAPSTDSILYTDPIDLPAAASMPDENSVIRAQIFDSLNPSVRSKMIRLEFRVFRDW